MFLSKLKIQHRPGVKAGDKGFLLLSPLSYLNRDDTVVTVPAGFPFDGASVPRPIWVLFPPAGQYLEAAAVHDWLYEHQTIQGQRIDRETADNHLLWGMEDLGVSWVKRQMIYRAVRLGGWVSFNKYTMRLWK